MLRIFLGAILFLVIYGAAFGVSAIIATAIGYPEKTHLFVLLLIVVAMIFGAAVVHGLDRGWNPFK
jgi:hypothetical protein